MQRLLVTIPHSGEKIPPQAPWLNGLPEEILMCDVDRYVDRLYEPALQALQIPYVKTEWHRYAGDLNRFADDVDSTSVLGSPNAPGTFARGFLWTITTTETKLMPGPISPAAHQELVKLIYEPFHQSIHDQYEKIKAGGSKNVYHLDAHSMPSLGTRQHKDPGETRAEIVVSDCIGKSCSKEYRDLVIAAYVTAGFKVGYNWPYVGGRVTERYGEPAKGHHAIQVEMNRALYMDEKSKAYKPELAANVQKKVQQALSYIQSQLDKLA